MDDLSVYSIRPYGAPVASCALVQRGCEAGGSAVEGFAVKHFIAFTAALLINAAVLNGLGLDVRESAGTVESAELGAATRVVKNVDLPSISLAATHHLH